MSRKGVSWIVSMRVDKTVQIEGLVAGKITLRSF